MRRALLATGLLLLAALWLGPLPELSRASFSAHMTLHMAVVAVAAPLLALGIAGGAFDPVRFAPNLIAPIPASMAEFAAVWTWHAPLPHTAARCGTGMLVAEQLTFLVAGLFLWLAAFGGDRQRAEAPLSLARGAGGEGCPSTPVACSHHLDTPAPVSQPETTEVATRAFGRRARTAAGVLAMLLTSMHMTLLGALLALTPRPLYARPDAASLAADPAWAGALCLPPELTTRVLGLAPLQDQHLGGALMIAVGGLAYFVGGLWLTADLLRDKPFERRTSASDPVPLSLETSNPVPLSLGRGARGEGSDPARLPPRPASTVR